jgi:3-methylcrotonyl-CoA carboxylase alpha subunit
MGRAAVEAAKAVGYVGAGTVEFIVEPDEAGGVGRFFFMEMNTRLQVEHPVTEMITGLDLVEWQLRVASGERLPLSQEELAINGHAIEARIYAEDPDKGFLPSVGKLVHLAPPPAGHHVRIDTGVEQGDEISPHYDPMIAKLIVWDVNRDRALARMREALARYRIVGVSNNVEFLSRLVATPAFANADLDTALIERENALLFGHDKVMPDEVWWLAALAELSRNGSGANKSKLADNHSPWAATDGWRINSHARRGLIFRHGDNTQEVVVSYGATEGAGASTSAQQSSVPSYTLALRGPEGGKLSRQVQARASLTEGGRLLAQLGERRLQVDVVVAGERRIVFHAGRAWPLVCVDALHQQGTGDDSHGGLMAPMPGKVIAWLVEPGAKVDKGAPLLVLEAMKMEHTLQAPAAGTVKGFKYAPGEQVGEGVALVEFEVG